MYSLHYRVNSSTKMLLISILTALGKIKLPDYFIFTELWNFYFLSSNTRQAGHSTLCLWYHATFY